MAENTPVTLPRVNLYINESYSENDEIPDTFLQSLEALEENSSEFDIQLTEAITEFLLVKLFSVHESFNTEVQNLKLRQGTIEKGVETLSTQYSATSQQLEALESRVAKLAIGNQEIPYLFMLSDKQEWFSGRESELLHLHSLLLMNEDVKEQKVQIASVCGLGGIGKTSLAAEYGHRWKHDYDGGAFWFSGEDEAKFAKSVDEHAVSFGTLDATPDRTLLKTLEVISKIQKPWLLVLDDMDEYKLCSNIKMLLSGPWKQRVRGSGHVLITTRRDLKIMVETIRGFKESQCLQLDSFNLDDGKDFVFKRTGLTRNEDALAEAANLVEILGGLPLALEQACAYISHVSSSLSMYLEQYKKYSLELLNEQEATPVSLHEPSERLAVRTTWLLNFNYIKQITHGSSAVRFLHACAFFNPNEIQKELVNPGKPPIDDAAYRDYVNTPLGSSHILKLLSDFSLFRKNKGSSLTVHRLVQDVIRDKLQSENQKILSMVDAVRILCFAFLKCPSPDDLACNDIHEVNKRVSTQAANPSLFCTWQKMCQHAQEVLTVLYSCDVLDQRVLTPETARIVYECALHLNVGSNTDEAKQAFDFAHKIIRLSGITNSKLPSLFPHEVPLPESVRRYIFYSCSANTCDLGSSDSNKCTTMELLPKSEKMYAQGSCYFNEGNFGKAVEMYSCAMTTTSLFNPKLFCDRALAYIKLQLFEKALKDSEEYISLRSKCWLGLATKALALHGLNEIWQASCFAALAFFYNRNIFLDYEPFKSTFSILENRIVICNNSSALTDLLLKPVSNSQAVSGSPGKIIMIEPGDYQVIVKENQYNSTLFNWTGLTDNACSAGLIIDDCILHGVENTKSSVVISFFDLPFLALGIMSGRRVMAVNISFVFSLGHWESQPKSIATFLNCSFTSSLEKSSHTFHCLGIDTFRDCCFKNCQSPGLTVMGKAKVERCVISGGEYSGVHVREGGRLEIRESKIHGNEHGIYIVDSSQACNITNCDIFDQQTQGILVGENSSNVTVENCRIYHNDRNGIYILEDSSAFISYCEIFDNGWHGIATVGDGRCTVSHNKISKNKSGGVQVVPVDKRKRNRPSVVESNEIFDNRGPGIEVRMMSSDTPSHTNVPPTKNSMRQSIEYMRDMKHYIEASVSENKCYNNADTLSPTAPKDNKKDPDFCSYCRKKCFLRCSKCFVTTYCDKKCQKEDWKKHKKECLSILDKFTVTVNIPSKEEDLVNYEHAMFYPGLAPKGPLFFSPPKIGERFLVKIVAADEIWHSNSNGPMLTICDRSRTIDGSLDKKKYPKLYSIVRECGLSSTVVEGWKKKFFWAQLHDKDPKKLNVFTTKFPPNKDW